MYLCYFLRPIVSLVINFTSTFTFFCAKKFFLCAQRWYDSNLSRWKIFGRKNTTFESCACELLFIFFSSPGECLHCSSCEDCVPSELSGRARALGYFLERKHYKNYQSTSLLLSYSHLMISIIETSGQPFLLTSHLWNNENVMTRAV